MLPYNLYDITPIAQQHSPVSLACFAGISSHKGGGVLLLQIQSCDYYSQILSIIVTFFFFSKAKICQATLSQLNLLCRPMLKEFCKHACVSETVP